MVIQVIRRYVKKNPDVRFKRGYALKLEAAEFKHQKILQVVFFGDLYKRGSYIPTQQNPFTGGFKNPGDEG